MDVLVSDQRLHGARTARSRISLDSGRATVRELIRRRVQQEVERYNQSLPEIYRGLVQPEESEQILNGFRMKARRQLDWEAQFRSACESFQKNGFLVLVDGLQVTGLDDPLELHPGSEVEFLKLVPLVGG
jgi:hypothetical protein